jgi:hypothetical protein
MPSSLRAALIFLALGFAAAIIWIFRDYQKWRALGPGGLPANLIGWLKTTRMRLQKGDPLDTDSYTAQIGAAGDCSFLAELPKREGRRPAIAVHPVPHRQLDQFVGDDMRGKIKNLFDAKVAGGSELLEYKQSYLEKRHQALFLRRLEGAHSHAANSHGEIAHIHPSDNSMHMIFSASDAHTVILGGWGERHPLAGRPLPGTELVLPDTYLLIYPPRNDFELKVAARLLDAAVRHMAVLPRSEVNPVGDEQQEAKHA